MQATQDAVRNTLVRFSTPLLFGRYCLSKRDSIKGLVIKVKTASEHILPGFHSFQEFSLSKPLLPDLHNTQRYLALQADGNCSPNTLTQG